MKTARADYFWKHVRKTETCWIWIGALSDSHGRIGREFAHRVAWTLANGPIPADRSVLHKCVFGPCVNPEHLYIGGSVENGADTRLVGTWGNHIVDEVTARTVDDRVRAGDHVAVVAFEMNIRILDVQCIAHGNADQFCKLVMDRRLRANEARWRDHRARRCRYDKADCATVTAHTIPRESWPKCGYMRAAMGSWQQRDPRGEFYTSEFTVESVEWFMLRSSK